MPQYEHAVLVGVGLLGGSIGMALLERGLARRVVGVGRDGKPLQDAISLGAITESSQDLASACRGAALVVVCTPVQSIAGIVNQCLKSKLGSEAVITDVGSTKVGICSSLDGDAHEHFCGSHPIAGSDKSGVNHASGNLLNGQLTIVTPTSRTSEPLVRQVEEFWQSLGSRTLRMSPPEHDQAIARVSHLPHLVASALSAITDAELLPLAGPGWRDTTRVAAGNIEMWQQIIAENRSPVVDALWQFSHSLMDWIEAIENGDSAKLVELLKSGKDKRDQIRKESG